MLVTLPSRRHGRGQGRGSAALGSATHVLLATGRSHEWRGRGALSIKCFFGGRAVYDVGTGRHAVDDGSYLVLNEGQDYAVTVDSPTPVTSFCLFFEDGLAEEIERSLVSPTERLLDDASGARGEPLRLFERTYPHDRVLSPALFRLRASLPAHRDEPDWLMEQLHHVVERLLETQHRVRAETRVLPALRPATREELARRLHRARDFIEASLEEAISLEDVSRAACLSPNHLLRTFRALFGASPHQYLTERRLARARALLRAGDLPVTEVALAVGFSSLSSFSRLFRRRVGLSPASYRRGTPKR